MSDPVGISLEKIRDFMLSKGGKVTNHELVKHFKDALTKENTRDEARILFKELINTVATITKDADGRKQLVLKKKYRTPTPSPSAAVNVADNPGYTGIALPTLSMSPETPVNLRYKPVYQTSNDTSPIGDSLGSPLSLKSAPSFSSDSPIPSSMYSSRRASQDSLLSQFSLRTALSTATYTSTSSVSSSSVPSTSNTSSTSTLSHKSFSSSAIPISTQREGNTRSSSSSAVSSTGRTSSSSSAVSSTDRISANPSSLTQREMSDESMYSTFSEICPPSPNLENSIEDSTDPPPPVPPRRKSNDKIRLELRESNDEIKPSTCSPARQTVSSDGSSVNNPVMTPDLDNKENVGNVSKISVKERSQKFDRMASEIALNKAIVLNNANGNSNKKKHDKTDKDEEDTGSVQLMDGKCREWLVRCAQGDYQTIVKLAAENPKLVKFKDPTNGYTALHWGAKHGNLDIVKLIAGTHKADVNSRTNGGYTPLHLATQFGHEEVCTQLVKVYKADENMRDYSGRKPRQYQKTSGTSISADTFRSEYGSLGHETRKKRRNINRAVSSLPGPRRLKKRPSFLSTINLWMYHPEKRIIVQESPQLPRQILRRSCSKQSLVASTQDLYESS
uniref:Putative ankyrin repeat and dhhc-type zn-finger domain protein n=1 Tax=Panstrongylus megistus TaxID=65343 RepID=A0A069DW29_9HEMI